MQTVCPWRLPHSKKLEPGSQW